MNIMCETKARPKGVEMCVCGGLVPSMERSKGFREVGAKEDQLECGNQASIDQLDKVHIEPCNLAVQASSS